MCSILGGYSLTGGGLDVNLAATMASQARNRGRDGDGRLTAVFPGEQGHIELGAAALQPLPVLANVWLQNARAIPTTELIAGVDQADQQQPLRAGPWAVVHNGTIANDRELWAELGLPGAPPVDSAVIAPLLAAHGFAGLAKLKGSYAIAAYNHHTGALLLACNYKPIYLRRDRDAVYFQSQPEGLPGEWAKMPAYSALLIKGDTIAKLPLPGYVPQMHRPRRALVIASGGLDSTVAAAALVDDGFEVTLLHVQYQAQAQEREMQAVTDVAAALGCQVITMQQPLFAQAAQSPLTTPGAAIADGEAGAEFAHEWVPARNLVLAAMATAVAEAQGFTYIALGNNLEESGAYPDNEQEFVRGLNALMPNAVADGGCVRFIEPVGNLMKHEIAALGHALHAPVAESWSCYRGGELHCGECGPCFMRRTAHQYAGVPDPTRYAH